jgi:hypothetical protein
MKTKKSAIFAGIMALILGFAFIGCKADSNSGGKPPNVNADYGISLSETSAYTFPAAAIGYAEQTAKSVTITNTGKQSTGALIAALSGANGEAFVLSPSTIASIATGSTAAFTVVPKTGLAEGFYTAAITVSGGIVSAKSFDVRFSVGDSSSSPSTVFTSVAAALAYLNAHSDGNTADKSVPLKLNVNLASYTDNWDVLVVGLSAAGKYAALDLSLCSMSGTEFDLYHDTDPDPNDGRKYIVSLVLPNSAASIVNSGNYIIPPEYPPIIVPGGTGSGPGSAPSVADSGGYMPYYNEIPIIENSDYSSLKTVSGANVETIESSAFSYCTSLTTVFFPKVTSIKGGNNYGTRGPFQGCMSLTSAAFPEATSIGEWAFDGCTSLASVDFPEAISIWHCAFFGCTSLTTVSFPKVTTIKSSYAFGGCTSLNEVYFPKATDTGSGGSATFIDCTSLTTVFFPKATTVSDFYGCTALTTVSFPEATTVGGFSGCTALTTVSIPKATTVSGFSGCTSLTSVSFPEATSVSIGSDYGSYTALTEVYAPKATSVSFHDCPDLTEVYAPKATTFNYAVKNNTSLTSVSFSDATSVSFSGCTSLTTVTAPKATSVSFYNCTSLTTVSFPEATSVSFSGCTSLTSVSFPKAMTIGYGAFANSGSVPLTITMGTAAPMVGNNIFDGVTATKNVTVKVPSGAAGYDEAWKTAFKGGNSYINLVIEYY